jgi:hypothetical protein
MTLEHVTPRRDLCDLGADQPEDLSDDRGGGGFRGFRPPSSGTGAGSACAAERERTTPSATASVVSDDTIEGAIGLRRPERMLAPPEEGHPPVNRP